MVTMLSGVGDRRHHAHGPVEPVSREAPTQTVVARHHHQIAAAGAAASRRPEQQTQGGIIEIPHAIQIDDCCRRPRGRGQSCETVTESRKRGQVQIPGQGKATWTAKFLSGITLFEDPALNIDPATVDGITADAGAAVEAVEWRAVTVTGTYLPEGALRVVNRSQNGRAGDNLVVPLALDDGRVVYVTRGFVPLGMDDPELPNTERVTVTGRIRPTSERSGVAARDPVEGVLTEVQRLDLGRLAKQVPGELANVSLDLVTSSPADDLRLATVALPGTDLGPHLSYMVQWIMFSAAAIVGWVLVLTRELRRSIHRND
jgi:cytochrome oxidase assembly protein ShyY1